MGHQTQIKELLEKEKMAVVPMRAAMLCLNCESISIITPCRICGSGHQVKLNDWLGGPVNEIHPKIQMAIEGMKKKILQEVT